MPLRLIEVYIPINEYTKQIKEEILNFQNFGVWQDYITENQKILRILVDAQEANEILDQLEKKYSNLKDFRIILLPVQASIPRIDTESDKQEQKTKKLNLAFGKSISREELYNEIAESTNTNQFFIFLVILSSIVASTAILKNNVAVIIGAMVIAPLIGPNVALSLATTLGDKVLFKKSLKANITGFLIAVAVSFLIGAILYIDPNIPELASRTKVGLSDIVLALASGSAGALAYTMGLPTAIIGVMVAVALLPPTVTFGMLMSSEHYSLALGSLLLLFVNIICVNLSGVLTFLFQGVRPLTWWESKKAKQATKFAIFIWSVLLLILTILIIEFF
ncbi:MAG: TIGR00341 family protein [Candidatus Dadabacteria bacterium]|nr:TIGR00341 family protein [Candidatus Dadabacteria bacterium]NIQ15063.1 TIGR00341 family protein [Candidatus Dadabacteria bacterium]